jgi:hypothetical protein
VLVGRTVNRQLYPLRTAVGGGTRTGWRGSMGSLLDSLSSGDRSRW